MRNNKEGSQCYRGATWYPLVGLVFILWMPEAFVSENILLKQIIAAANSWIPAINNLSTVSDFPWLTSLYLAVMWTLFPLMVWWWGVNMPYTKTLASMRQCLTLLIVTPLVIAFLSTIIYWFPFHPDTRQLSFHAGRSGIFLSAILHSRLGLGLSFGAFFYLVSLLVMAWLRVVWLCVIRAFRSIGISF